MRRSYWAMVLSSSLDPVARTQTLMTVAAVVVGFLGLLLGIGINDHLISTISTLVLVLAVGYSLITTPARMHAELQSPDDRYVTLANEFHYAAAHWGAGERTPRDQERYDECRERLSLAIMEAPPRIAEALREYQHEMNTELTRWKDHPAPVKLLQTKVLRSLRRAKDTAVSRLEGVSGDPVPSELRI